MSSENFKKNNADGKKIIFIGDSFIHYGKAVLNVSTNDSRLSSRINDQGYFYQLSKANGDIFNVTNWTFGAHSLTSIIVSDTCTMETRKCYGTPHKSGLTDLYYDYVVVSPGRRTTQFTNEITSIKETFSVNPNAEFICLCSSGVYGQSTIGFINYDVLNNLKTAEKMGYKIVDWGGFLNGIINGEISIPDSKYIYDKNSFIINKNDHDGHHPNLLTGYLTALGVYVTITGKKAAGQPFSFVTDSSINPVFDIEKFKELNYKYCPRTNFDRVLSDSNEMLALQKAFDEYLSKRSYRNYNFELTEK